ncbi:MAG TPA: hypothetical protein VHV55_22250 [Pirellulales bacterium]|nr:hypothetical protein [Pirellulales bacterium]
MGIGGEALQRAGADASTGQHENRDQVEGRLTMRGFSTSGRSIGGIRRWGIAWALGAVLACAGVRECRAAELAGCWEGRWESCTSGHQGPLNAKFCKLDDTHYRVDFSGRFFKIFPFHYSVTLMVTGQDGDTLLLSGSSYLGRMFGTFHYSARATECSFVADYTSCKDRGRFILHRTCCCR